MSPAPLYQPFPMLPGRRAQAWRHQPAFRRPRHFHEEPEINLVTRGHCKLGVGDQVLYLTAGELIVFQPGQDHELLEASPDLGLHVFALRADLHARALGGRTVSAIGISALPAEELATFEAELTAAGQLQDVTTTETHLADLFARALAAAPKAPATTRRILTTLRTEHSVTESALAERLRTTPSGISRHFRRTLGVPLVEYRARLRLMRFIDLVDRGHTLTQAALEADFGSYAQCHRVFRRTLRCSPQHYFAGLRARRDTETA